MVEFGVGLGLEALAEALPELVGVQATGHMLATKDIPDRIAIGVRCSQAPVLRVLPRVGDALGHVAPFHINPEDTIPSVLNRWPAGSRFCRGARFAGQAPRSSWAEEKERSDGGGGPMAAMITAATDRKLSTGTRPMCWNGVMSTSHRGPANAPTR